MSILSSKNIFFVEGWAVDPLHNKISNGSEERDIEPKAMQILEYLARHPGEVVQRNELFKAAWPNQNVTEEALTRSIGHLRQCFADEPKSPRYIATIHKIGYRLIAKVSNSRYLKRRSLEVSRYGQSFYVGKAFKEIGKISIFLLTTLLIYFAYDQPVTANLSKLEAKYITTDLGFESWQSISPDGLNIVYYKFIKEKNDFDDFYDTYTQVLLMKNIASNRVSRLSTPKGTPSHPVWSPDNQRIAYTFEYKVNKSDREYKIYSTDVVTGVSTLHANTSSHSHGLTWSPDGRYLIYLDGETNHGVNALYRVDITTNRQERLFPKNFKNHDVVYAYPKFSPDGSFIAIVRENRDSSRSINLIDTTSFSIEKVYDANTSFMSFEWKDNNTLFIADGSVVAMSLFEYSIADGEKKYLPIKDKHIADLSYSRARKRLVYESVRQPMNIQFINFEKGYVYKDYGNLTELNTKALEAMESPDGKYTAVISSNGDLFDVWLRDNLSEQNHKLTSLQATLMSDLDWSPDGKFISFVASSEFYKNALFWVDVNTKKLDMFSHKGNSQHSLVGWEENNRILFTSNYGGEWRLWLLNTNTKQHNLLTPESMFYGRLSPDRKKLYFVKNHKSGVWEADLRDLDPVKIPGTNNIGQDKGWTVTKDGLIYFIYGDISGYDHLYFYDFTAKKHRLIAQAPNIHINRINWANNRIYYSHKELRDSDIVMIENL